MMRRAALVVASGMLAAFAASCTTEQSSDPGPTLTSTTTTTEVPVATTEVVETTEATTTSTTSTTTTLPPEPVTGAVALAAGGEAGGWLPLGGWSGSAWAEPSDDPSDPGISPGTSVTISNLAGDQGASVTGTVEACFDGRVGPSLDVSVGAPDPPGFGYSTMATTGHDRPLLPRPVAVTATGPAAYGDLGEAIFAGDPVDPTQGSVVQVVVADLDGDDDDEAIVSFEFVQPTVGPGTPGDFSALYVVDTTSRTPATVLAAHVPSDLPTEGSFAITERVRVIDVADYNGDGRMEVAVHTWYYEGASVLVYEYDGTSLRQVLGAGCGA